MVISRKLNTYVFIDCAIFFVRFLFVCFISRYFYTCQALNNTKITTLNVQQTFSSAISVMLNNEAPSFNSDMGTNSNQITMTFYNQYFNNRGGLDRLSTIIL